MANLIASLRRRIGFGLRTEDGTATIPFVIFLPFYMLLVTSSVEMGMLMVRHVMLERGLDLAVRDLRLGTWTPPDQDELKRVVCNNAGIIPDCTNVIMIELRPVDTNTWEPLSSGPTCVDRSAVIAPDDPAFTSGGEDELMLVRACVKFRPLFPTSGAGFAMPKDDAGDYALISATAFVNEPNGG
jgi:Flp pilus assembly protein TadG